jgi:D-amino-acid dehydrogenase
MTFLYHYVKTSLCTGENGAKERGRILVQLAKANRFALNNYTHGYDKEFSKRIGLQEGFISVHRTKEKALHALEEAKEFSEDAELLSTVQAVAMEPKIANLPLKDAYFVYRKHDQTADCAEYIRHMINSLSDQEGVSYEISHGYVKDIKLLESECDQPYRRFKITSNSGHENEFDYVILAAGVKTPVFAAKLKVGQACPIYPLRGYSLTMFLKNEGIQPFLRKAMSFDSMYCTSVAPNMVRMAGFGEIAGFPKYNKTSVSRSGPMVLEKYGKYIFGQESAIDIEATALPCYRPITPDDIPVVGSVRKIPRLFVHCGHGTLGWTMSLATAHCLAQDVCDGILGIEDRDSFVLPDGSLIDREILSPNRFSFLPW